MRHVVRLGGITAVFWLLALAALAGLQDFGQLGQEVARLSGKAIMAAEQRGTLQEFVTLYPPLPLLLSLPFAFLSPSGVPPAALASVLLAALFGTALYCGFRNQGISRAVALAAALLLVANQFSLYALASGPGTMLLMLGMLMLAFGLFGLSASNSTAPDAMMTALALGLLAFAHPYGMMLVLASLPGLALASPPALVARTPISLFLILLFPVIFGLFSFVYARWVLGAEPFSFLDAAVGAQQMGEKGEPMRLGYFLLTAIPGLFLAAPLVLAFLIWNARRPSHLFPAVAVVSTVLFAGVAQVVLRGYVETTLVVAMIVPGATVCAMQAIKERTMTVLFLLLAGMAGALAFAAVPAYLRGEALWQLGAAAKDKRADANLKPALCGREGVLVDTRVYPQLIELCGTAKGIVIAGEAEFDIQMQSRRLTSPFVLVGEPGAEQDRIVLTFPDLYDHGADGYVLAYRDVRWRLYARIPAQPVS